MPNEAALGAWLQQVPRLARLQLADCWVVHQVGPNPRLAQLEGLVPDSGLPATLEELRLFPWPAPPPHRDGTGVERYMHLLEYPRLRSFTLWPAPGRLATSDFKLLQVPTLRLPSLRPLGARVTTAPPLSSTSSYIRGCPLNTLVPREPCAVLASQRV